MKKNIVLTAFITSVLLLSGFKTVPEPVKITSTARYISNERLYNELFPRRNQFYTYNAFLKALDELSAISIKVENKAGNIYKITRTNLKTKKAAVVRQDADWKKPLPKQKSYHAFAVSFNNFCSGKNAEVNKKELTAFFAHIAHTTRNGENEKYNDGLMLLHERNTALPYTKTDKVYPASYGKKYYGRGPLRLTGNSNYGLASLCIFGNKYTLLQNPDLITTDAVTAFKTAIYFWMMPQNAKPSAHDAMTGKWQPNHTDKLIGRLPGFGMTTNVLNGKIECNKGMGYYDMNDRIGFYQAFLKKMNVTDPNCACSCGKMMPY